MEEIKKYYWIRLKTNFFGRDEIDFLMSQKNGSNYVVLYQMLCLQTANTNGKLVTQVGEMIVPYDINKIVRDTKYFDFDTVTVALELFKKLGLIYIAEDNNLIIAGIEDMVGKEPDKTNAERQRRFREKQKQKKLTSSNNNVTSNVTSNVTNNEKVTESIEHRDKSIENRDNSSEITVYTSNCSADDAEAEKAPYAEIVEFFNENCKSFPQVKSLSKERKGLLNARFKEFGLDGIKEAFMKAEKSDFLKGKINGFKANFDWIIKPSNMCKVIEGNYDNRNAPEPEPPKPKEYVDVLKTMGLV